MRTMLKAGWLGGVVVVFGLVVAPLVSMAGQAVEIGKPNPIRLPDGSVVGDPDSPVGPGLRSPDLDYLMGDPDEPSGGSNGFIAGDPDGPDGLWLRDQMMRLWLLILRLRAE